MGTPNKDLETSSLWCFLFPSICRDPHSISIDYIDSHLETPCHEQQKTGKHLFVGWGTTHCVGEVHGVRNLGVQFWSVNESLMFLYFMNIIQYIYSILYGMWWCMYHTWYFLVYHHSCYSKTPRHMPFFLKNIIISPTMVPLHSCLGSMPEGQGVPVVLGSRIENVIVIKGNHLVARQTNMHVILILYSTYIYIHRS